ncbi:TPA: hypothetical protein ACH729_005199, partial [Escherichia coli]
SKSIFLKKTKSELILGENISETSGHSDEETIKTEKDIMIEKAKDVMRKVIINRKNKNSDLSDEQDNDIQEYHSGINPWFG